MKLYTEEQVRKAMVYAYLSCSTPEEVECIFDKLTPIELPSDEDVKKMRKAYIEHVNTTVHKDLERDGYLDVGFFKGAKYVIDKIQGGNK